jgi:hypothetical protein
MEMHVIMNKKIIIAPIVAIVAIFLVSLSDDSSSQKDDVSFHVTLADPELYINGVYSDTFTIEKGDYIFRFVPNGSSPKVLSIILSGNTVDFSEDFKLVATSNRNF